MKVRLRFISAGRGLLACLLITEGALITKGASTLTWVHCSSSSVWMRAAKTIQGRLT